MSGYTHINSKLQITSNTEYTEIEFVSASAGNYTHLPDGGTPTPVIPSPLLGMDYVFEAQPWVGINLINKNDTSMNYVFGAQPFVVKVGSI